MKKNHHSTSLRNILLKVLKRGNIFIAISLTFIAILLLAINYKTMRLINQTYPLIDQLHHLDGWNAQNSDALLAWIENPTPQLAKKLEKLMNTEILNLLNKIEPLLKGKNDINNFNIIKEKISHLRWVEWRIVDIVNSAGNQPAQFSYEKSLLPLFSLLKNNLLQPQLSNITAYNRLLVYDALINIDKLLTSYLQTGNEKYLPALKQAQLNLLQVEQLSVNNKEWKVATATLSNHYLQQVNTIIKLRRSPKWNVVLYKTSQRFYPLKNNIDKNIFRFTVEKEKKLSQLNNLLFYLGIFTFLFVIVILLLFIYFGRRYINRLTLLIVNPIESLIEIMNKLAHGLSHIKIKSSPITEFNQLTKSFKLMLKQRSLYEKKLQANEKSLRHLAYHDRLTGLINYPYLKKQLTKTLYDIKVQNKKLKLILCHIAIHNLNDINNVWGERTCDHLISIFAKKILHFKPDPTLCARISSSNFVVSFILDEDNELIPYLDKLVDYLKKTIHIEEAETVMQFSAGVAYYPIHADNTTQLLHYARFAALQVDKQSPIKYKLFDLDDMSLLTRHSTLEKDLVNAIKNKQIYLVYQPQFELRNNKLIGCEALVRWNHPQYGLISPLEFIPLAEQSEQIILLGRYIQELALANYSQWVADYSYPVKLAINASLLELTNKHYASFLLTLVNQYHLSPSSIEIEVTESIASQYPELITKVVKELRSLGFTMAIDDFGTGYSALERLRSLEVDLIKIDKIFIDEIHLNSEAKKLFSSIINLLSTLDLPILVEGVEKEEQLAILKSLPCQFAQGYYFSEPLIAEKMADLLKQFNH